MGFEVPFQKSAEKAVDNLTAPSIEFVGHTLSDILYLALGGISHAADKLRIKREAILKRYNDEVQLKLNSVPKDELIEPDMQIVGQAIQKSQFCIEHDELRLMFANLVVASVDRRKAPSIRPCFSEILSQLTPTDVRLLLHIKTKQAIPIANFSVQLKDGFVTAFKNVYINNEFKNLPDQSLSLDTLKYLGLVDLDYLHILTDKSEYDRYSNLRLESMENESIAVHTMIPSFGIASLTELGAAFLKAVS